MYGMMRRRRGSGKGRVENVVRRVSMKLGGGLFPAIKIETVNLNMMDGHEKKEGEKETRLSPFFKEGVQCVKQG